MKAPDHHPYLTEGDLRTAEDVLEWLARPRCCKTLGGHIARLRARLDRERRQACRRGARVNFGAAVRTMREAMNIRGRRRDKELANAVWDLPLQRWGYWPHRHVLSSDAVALLDHLATALAFRAAARAR